MKRTISARMFWNGKAVPESSTLKLPGMVVTSALTFTQATRPHNTQTSRSCAFVGVLSCAQRHRMLNDTSMKGKMKNYFHKGQPAKQIVDSFKHDVPSGFVHDDEENLVGADPYAFADYLFEKVERWCLVDSDDVNSALKKAEKQPCVFPCLPVTRRGHCVVYSKEGFVKEFHSKYQLPKEDRIWHSQCIVGSSVDLSTQERYFVCLQSWKGSVLTFVPAMSTAEIIDFSRLPANRKTLSIPTIEELHLKHSHEVIFPMDLKDKHAPSQKEFTANKMSGMLIPPMHSGYLPEGIFT